MKYIIKMENTFWMNAGITRNKSEAFQYETEAEALAAAERLNRRAVKSGYKPNAEVESV